MTRVLLMLAHEAARVVLDRLGRAARIPLGARLDLRTGPWCETTRRHGEGARLLWADGAMEFASNVERGPVFTVAWMAWHDGSRGLWVMLTTREVTGPAAVEMAREHDARADGEFEEMLSR